MKMKQCDKNMRLTKNRLTVKVWFMRHVVAGAVMLGPTTDGQRVAIVSSIPLGGKLIEVVVVVIISAIQIVHVLLVEEAHRWQ